VSVKSDTGSDVVGSDRVAKHTYSLPLYVESHTVVIGPVSYFPDYAADPPNEKL
jgi:hypothetical protein